MHVPLQITISFSPRAAEDTGDVLVRQVPRVPVDVFQEIVSHLHFEDRLNISLLSKDLHAALPPRHTYLVLRATHQLASLAAYICGDSARASSLRSLHILINDILPSENPSELLAAQKDTLFILENANKLEELVCRGDAAGDLLPDSLIMCRRLLRLELKGISHIVTGEGPHSHIFPLSLRSFHFTCCDLPNLSPPSAVRILRLVSRLPSLDTIIVDSYLLSMFVLSDHRPSSNQPSVRTLQLVDSPRTRVHPAFVRTLSQRQSFPNLATLHFNRTYLPDATPGYSVGHLILTDTPDHLGLENDPGLWKARRVTYVRGPDSQSGKHSSRSGFSLSSHRWVNLSTVLCLSISAPVIAPCIWADLTAGAWDVRLLELESSAMSFVELVAPLINRPETDSIGIAADVPLTCISIATRELGLPWDSEETWERTRRDVLQGASRRFSALRYVAVATPHRPPHIAPTPAYPGDGIPVWTWWRVHRDSVGAPVEIREIPVWEGRRVREFLRNADAQAMRDFDRASSGE
ncbi:hypothetical protein V8D89_003950 [Ganoderma adspersum]